MTEPAQPKKSDLGVRVLSAIVMVAVAGTALWLGGWVWTAFVALVALGVLWEWWGLVRATSKSVWRRTAWILVGVIYVGTAASMLAIIVPAEFGRLGPLILLAVVVSTDVGAYFTGRKIGGPRIMPSISPSKTWSGLIGGIVSSVFVCTAFVQIDRHMAFVHFWNNLAFLWSDGPDRFQLNQTFESFVSIFRSWVHSVNPGLIIAGAMGAIVAQTGDFFESWMKRRARVKDSGKLIPGHGGLFDRVDGLLAVAFFLGLLIAVTGQRL